MVTVPTVEGRFYNWTVIRARPGRQFNMPDESVKVVVRVRPLSRKEQQDGHLATTVADEDQGTITCNNPKSDIADPPKVFTLFVSNMNGLVFSILISDETNSLTSPPHNSKII